MKRVCVFCGSYSGRETVYSQAAYLVGQELSRRGLGLVYGGGSFGLMGILANSCLDHGVEVIGIIPDYLNIENSPTQKNYQLIVVKNMFERKSEMNRISDGFIVLPGGYGTLDELFEMVTLFQLKQHTKPIIVCNINQFFDPIYNQINHCAKQGFIPDEYKTIVTWSESVEETFLKLDSFKK